MLTEEDEETSDLQREIELLETVVAIGLQLHRNEGCVGHPTCEFCSAAEHFNEYEYEKVEEIAKDVERRAKEDREEEDME
jgi:hypothetical protein